MAFFFLLNTKYFFLKKTRAFTFKFCVNSLWNLHKNAKNIKACKIIHIELFPNLESWFSKGLILEGFRRFLAEREGFYFFRLNSRKINTLRILQTQRVRIVTKFLEKFWYILVTKLTYRIIIRWRHIK